MCMYMPMFLQSSMGGKDGGESPEVGVVKVLPSTLVSESYSASETVTMTTVDHEKYTCLLPDLSGEWSSKVSRSVVTCEQCAP